MNRNFSTNIKTKCFTFAACLALLCGCATPKPKTVEQPQITESEKNKQEHQTIDTALRYVFKSPKNSRPDDPFLMKLIEQTSPLLPDHPTKLLWIKPLNGIWLTCSVPRQTLFISQDLVKGLRFENELATYVFFEIYSGNLIKLSNANTPSFQDLVEWKPFHEFSPEQTQNLLEQTFGQIVASGYDPRGMYQFFEYLQKNESHVLYSKEWLADAVRWTRRKVARMPPVRNPIIKTVDFIAFRKRNGF